MIETIKLAMAELVAEQPDFMPGPVTALSQRRWMMGEDNGGPIIQFEPFDDGKCGLVYATTARDGSGPLRTSFLTLLLLEDSFATLTSPHGVCSGEATVTICKKVELEAASAHDIAHLMTDFMGVARAKLYGYLPMPTGVDPVDKTLAT